MWVHACERVHLCDTHSVSYSMFIIGGRFYHFYLGTIGHVAHGKSTVVKAISGVQVCNNMNTNYVYV